MKKYLNVIDTRIKDKKHPLGQANTALYEYSAFQPSLMSLLIEFEKIDVTRSIKKSRMAAPMSRKYFPSDRECIASNGEVDTGGLRIKY